MSIRFGREVLSDLEVAERREWLVTNGIGGYGSGTIAGSITRGYHGLLVAALEPPIDRRIMCVKLDETVTYAGASYALCTNRWVGGAVSPEGHKNMQSFELEGSIPKWRYACADALIDKRIWMDHGRNTTYVAYTVVSAETPMQLSARAIVDNRPSSTEPEGKSIIAGYHWFEDWGRDTMVSLPGLTLITGRPEVAALILRTFAQFISDGMLPNRFPDASEQPQYNTIDATLWYFQAIRSYFEATKDDRLVRDLYPKLQDIVDWHVKGTRYGIHVDPADGLLRGGQDGVQLTWMDAKVGDQVITPRIGKPVEVNALWYNALSTMVELGKQIGADTTDYRAKAEAAAKGFDRFWNDATGYCYDVLDGPNGNESALRPNQIFAVSLPDSPFTPERQRAVVDACSLALLTSHGLRSLAPSDPAFRGCNGGDQFHRDSAYHQGTVWAWLIGPFVKAHLRVYKDRDAARRFLEPLADHLRAAGVGTVSEIFDGDAPFDPKGCIAQAWSVAEILHAYELVETISF
jgi:glycogen debranching enzyme